MASRGVVGFVGLEDLSLELAASLLRSGYAVQAFEVSLFLHLLLLILFLFHELIITLGSVWFPGKKVRKREFKIWFSSFVLQYYTCLHCSFFFFFPWKRKKWKLDRGKSGGNTFSGNYMLFFLVFGPFTWKSRDVCAYTVGQSTDR